MDVKVNRRECTEVMTKKQRNLLGGPQNSPARLCRKFFPGLVGMPIMIVLTLLSALAFGDGNILPSSVDTGGSCSEVEFSISGYNRERQIVMQLKNILIQDAESMPRNGEREKVEIAIGVKDLNGDGIGDILAFFYHPFLCGSHGCSFAIFLSEGGGHYEALEVNTDQPVILASHRPDEIFNILLGGESVWKLKGRRYEFSGRREQACNIKKY